MVLVSSALNVMRGIPAKHWSARMLWWQGPATFGTGFNHRSSLRKQVSLSGWQPADGVEVTPSHLHILLMFFYGFFILHVVSFPCSIWPRTVMIALCCPLFRQNCCWNMPSGNHRKASWYAQITKSGKLCDLASGELVISLLSCFLVFVGGVFLQKTNVRKRAKRFVWLSETKASCAHFSWMFSFQNELFCPVGKFPTQEQTSSGNQFGNLQDKVVWCCV